MGTTCHSVFFQFLPVFFISTPDSNRQLVVGSEGNEIRVFKDDAILFDLQETDAIRCLCHLGRNCFAYALTNGTVGVYVGRDRVWRIKSKNEVIALAAFDANCDGRLELVTGWSSGKVDVRCIQTGQVLFKEQLKQPVAGLLVVDYDQDGHTELIVLSISGQVRAWQSTLESDAMGAALALSSDSGRRLKVIEQQQRLAQLMRKKQQMSIELRTYESSGRFVEQQRFVDEEELRSKARPTAMNEPFGAIPTDTQLKSVLLLVLGDNQTKAGFTHSEFDLICLGALKLNLFELTYRQGCVQLCLQTTNDTIIRAAAVFAEGIFKGESLLVHPNDSDISTALTIALRPLKNLALDLHVKSLVGYAGSYHYHVFELTRHLPRFAMFAIVTESLAQPSGSAVYVLNEKIPKVNFNSLDILI